MKYFYTFIFFTFPIILLGNNNIQKPNYFEIIKEVKNTSSIYYLPKLLKKYNSCDTNMSDEELKYLYYGYVCNNEYNTISYNEKIEKIKLLKSKSISNEEKIIICNNTLQKDIFDMDFFNLKSQALYNIDKNTKKSDDNFQFYYNLAKVIKSTGSGISKDSPIFLINKNHAIFISNMLGLDITDVFSMEGTLLKVKLQDNFFNTEYLYFDLSFTKEFEKFYIINQKINDEKAEKSSIENVEVEEKIIVKNTKDPNSDISSNYESSTYTNGLESDNNNNKTETSTETSFEDSELIPGSREYQRYLLEQKILERKKMIEEKKLEREKFLEERALARQKMIEEREKAD